MKKIIKLLVATGLALATTNMVFAQSSIPTAEIIKNDLVFAQSYKATAGTIKDDVDYALDERYYMDANINKFFINGNLNNKVTNPVNNKNLTQLDLQTAFQFDKLYLGVLGNTNFIWENSSKNETTNSKQQFGTASLKTLFGFKDMGISANFMINQIKDSKNSTKPDYTVLDFGANWGGTFNLNNFVLKPIVSLNFIPVIIDSKNPDPMTPKIDLFIFNMGLGSDFVFGKKSSLYSILGVNYNLTATTIKVSTSVPKPITQSIKSTKNDILLSYLINYNIEDRAILGGKIDITNSFISTKVILPNGTTSSDSVFNYSLVPTLGLGAKFIAVPSVFNINAGFTMNLPNVTVNTTKVTNSKTTNTVATTDLKPTITTGFEWTPYKNLVIDTAFSFNVGNTFDQIFSSINIGISYRK